MSEDQIKALKDWNEFQHEELPNSLVMDSKSFCDRCNRIDFGAARFYGSDAQLDVVPHHFSSSCTLDEIMQNLELCIFCKKIFEFFREWSLRPQPFDHPRLQAVPDPQKVCVWVASYIITCESDENARLIRIHVSLGFPRPSPKRGYFWISRQFQRCSQHPSSVSELCDGESLFDWERREEQPYSGRIRPLLADARLFRKWKESCCAMHGNSCSSIFTGRRLARLRFIDVEKRCVVESEDESTYAALSYVWGYKVELPMLTKSSYERFRQVGSLDSETLLPTIDDALEVTRSLGERYIWVDCLCIMQDDEADKLNFIQQMDSIFGFASVTIVAASGVDAKAGLPGVKPGSRSLEQIPFTIKGFSFLQTLDPEGSEWLPDARKSVRPSYLGKSVWYSRGWTLQEKIFSGRALIFTPEQVYWECQQASWREDGLWETTKFPTIYLHSLGDREFCQPWAPDVHSFQILYRKLVEKYSARRLTYGSDGLNAFAGILNALNRQAGQTFLWGLPTSFLGTALTWPCELSVKRRQDLCTVSSSDRDTTLCHFPSWSWIGWEGTILLNSKFGTLNWGATDLIIYYLDSSGSLVQAAAAPKTDIEEVQFVWKDYDTRTIVTREGIPESVLSRSIASNVLFFWSSTAMLHVQLHENGRIDVSRNDKVVPGYWSHTPSLNPGHKELAEFVLIGRENPYGILEDLALKDPRMGLALLLVSWDSHGVAYRRGLFNIECLYWVALDNRVWKMISLG